MKVYCLFCETIRCGYVARSIERVFGFRAISPKQVQHTWSEGRMVDIEHDLLPGYVFVYLEDGTLDIVPGLEPRRIGLGDDVPSGGDGEPGLPKNERELRPHGGIGMCEHDDMHPVLARVLREVRVDVDHRLRELVVATYR